MKPIIEAAGKDISHWFDERTKEVRNCVMISLDNSFVQKSNNSNVFFFASLADTLTPRPTFLSFTPLMAATSTFLPSTLPPTGQMTLAWLGGKIPTTALDV